MARKISDRRIAEIAKYIVDHQHLTHKQRAYYLGLNYNTYHAIYLRTIVEYKVLIIREHIIPSLTKDSLGPPDFT